jgi:hypothetical protein
MVDTDELTKMYVGGRREAEWETPGYRIKNKNPTQSYGERDTLNIPN